MASFYFDFMLILSQVIVMRMDRYNEETPKDDNYKTRTNKNQELYTDVYMNNVYVDFDNLKS